MFIFYFMLFYVYILFYAILCFMLFFIFFISFHFILFVIAQVIGSIKIAYRTKWPCTMTAIVKSSTASAEQLPIKGRPWVKGGLGGGGVSPPYDVLKPTLQ